MRALLDVNVLIALVDSNHEHHEIASRWLEDHIQEGWASCAITQNGCLRIMCDPKYRAPLPVAVVADALQEATDTTHHEFWPDASLLMPGVIDWQQVGGPKQITDLYLLALAAKNEGRLVTFDKKIVRRAALTASAETYFVIPAPDGGNGP